MKTRVTTIYQDEGDSRTAYAATACLLCGEILKASVTVDATESLSHKINHRTYVHAMLSRQRELIKQIDSAIILHNIQRHEHPL